MFGQTYLRIHPYHRFWTFQVFFNIQHVCIIHFRFQFLHTYVRTKKNCSKISHEGQKAHIKQIHVIIMSSKTTLRSIVLCCGQSVWTWKRCGQHWGHPARLQKIGPIKVCGSGGFCFLIVHWVVVSNIFYFHPYLGKIPILTNIFQMGWNHQLVQCFCLMKQVNI